MDIPVLSLTEIIADHLVDREQTEGQQP
jgi:hypothetical protein